MVIELLFTFSKINLIYLYTVYIYIYICLIMFDKSIDS